jgi:hypothetical protein
MPGRRREAKSDVEKAREDKRIQQQRFKLNLLGLLALLMFLAFSLDWGGISRVVSRWLGGP